MEKGKLKWMDDILAGLEKNEVFYKTVLGS